MKMNLQVARVSTLGAGYQSKEHKHDAFSTLSQAEGEILRNQKSFVEGSSFSGTASNRRFSIAPVAFQEAKMKEDLKSTTVKKNQLQLENDALR